MAKCAICNKGTGVKNRLIITRSHISKRNPRPEKANLRTVRIEEHGEKRKMKICAKCLKTQKSGI